MDGLEVTWIAIPKRSQDDKVRCVRRLVEEAMRGRVFERTDRDVRLLTDLYTPKAGHQQVVRGRRKDPVPKKKATDRA